MKTFATIYLLAGMVWTFIYVWFMTRNFNFEKFNNDFKNVKEWYKFLVWFVMIILCWALWPVAVGGNVMAFIYRGKQREEGVQNAFTDMIDEVDEYL